MPSPAPTLVADSLAACHTAYDTFCSRVGDVTLDAATGVCLCNGFDITQSSYGNVEQGTRLDPVQFTTLRFDATAMGAAADPRGMVGAAKLDGHSAEESDGGARRMMAAAASGGGTTAGCSGFSADSEEPVGTVHVGTSAANGTSVITHLALSAGAATCEAGASISGEETHELDQIRLLGIGWSYGDTDVYSLTLVYLTDYASGHSQSTLNSPAALVGFAVGSLFVFCVLAYMARRRHAAGKPLLPSACKRLAQQRPSWAGFREGFRDVRRDLREGGREVLMDLGILSSTAKIGPKRLPGDEELEEAPIASEGKLAGVRPKIVPVFGPEEDGQEGTAFYGPPQGPRHRKLWAKDQRPKVGNGDEAEADAAPIIGGPTGVAGGRHRLLRRIQPVSGEGDDDDDYGSDEADEAEGGDEGADPDDLDAGVLAGGRWFWQRQRIPQHPRVRVGIGDGSSDGEEDVEEKEGFGSELRPSPPGSAGGEGERLTGVETVVMPARRQKRPRRPPIVPTPGCDSDESNFDEEEVDLPPATPGAEGEPVTGVGIVVVPETRQKQPRRPPVVPASGCDSDESDFDGDEVEMRPAAPASSPGEATAEAPYLPVLPAARLQRRRPAIMPVAASDDGSDGMPVQPAVALGAGGGWWPWPAAQRPRVGPGPDRDEEEEEDPEDQGGDFSALNGAAAVHRHRPKIVPMPETEGAEKADASVVPPLASEAAPTGWLSWLWQRAPPPPPPPRIAFDTEEDDQEPSGAGDSMHEEDRGSADEGDDVVSGKLSAVRRSARSAEVVRISSRSRSRPRSSGRAPAFDDEVHVTSPQRASGASSATNIASSTSHLSTPLSLAELLSASSFSTSSSMGREFNAAAHSGSAAPAVSARQIAKMLRQMSKSVHPALSGIVAEEEELWQLLQKEELSSASSALTAFQGVLVATWQLAGALQMMHATRVPAVRDAIESARNRLVTVVRLVALYSKQYDHKCTQLGSSSVIKAQLEAAVATLEFVFSWIQIADAPVEQLETSFAQSPEQRLSTSAAGRATRISAREVVIDSDVIGRGRFASVRAGMYREATVAVKVFADVSTAKRSRVVNNMLLELGELRRVIHPNVLQIYGAVSDGIGDDVWLIQELAVMGTLRERLDDGSQKLVPGVKTRILVEVAQGMAYMHSMGVQHRNLRASNVLLDREFVAKLTDFGLPRTVAMLTGTETGRSWQECAPWCAPEVLSREGHVDASDVYSYGIVIWETMTEQEPGGDAARRRSLKAFVGALDNVAQSARLKPLLRACCDEKPKKRPTFEAICADFPLVA